MTLTFFLPSSSLQSLSLQSFGAKRIRRRKAEENYSCLDNVNIIRDFPLLTLLMMKSRKKDVFGPFSFNQREKGTQFSKLMQRYEGRNCTPKRRPHAHEGADKKCFTCSQAHLLIHFTRSFFSIDIRFDTFVILSQLALSPKASL